MRNENAPRRFVFGPLQQLVAQCVRVPDHRQLNQFRDLRSRSGEAGEAQQPVTDIRRAANVADQVVQHQRRPARRANDERSLDDQITAAQARLALKQQNLQTKFTAMEQALAQLQNQSQSLTSQINTNNQQR